MESIDDLITLRRPTARRPLLGITMLLVEDSRFACEAVRLLCARSGARIRRADSLTNARKHLAIYRPAVAIIDVGLPDGSGIDLIEGLTHGAPKIDVVLGTSGDSQFEKAVLDAGANGFLPKPIKSLANFQSAILNHLPADQQPPGPRIINDETVNPDRLALQDDLIHVVEVLDGDQDPETIDYVTTFLVGVANSAGDVDLQNAVNQFTQMYQAGADMGNPVENLTALIRAKLVRTATI